jgi:hypothetical protein
MSAEKGCRGGGCRRRRKRSAPKSGELYQIVQDGNVLWEKMYPSEGAVLSVAQNLLVKLHLRPREENVTYIVRLKPVLGPPDDLYHVVLTTEGHILTHPVAIMRT